MASQLHNNHHDVIIVGAGIVGLTMATLLSRLNLRIALLDNKHSQPHWSVENYGLRVSAITRASENIFRFIGIWDTINKMRISPYRYMQVWDELGNGAISFDSAMIGEANLGHIIENDVIITALIEHIGKRKNIDFIYPAKLTHFIFDEKNFRLESEDKHYFQANLIIGADGANSWLRKQANIIVDYTDYQHTALVTTVKTEKPHQKTAWQRFLRDGALALLPFPEQHYCSIVWSTQTERASQLMQLNDDAFNREITMAFTQRLGLIKVAAERASFPLRGQHAKEYVRPHFALIGDAAHTLHPLAGQGINLGILDAAALYEAIVSAQQKQKAIGCYAILRHYERARKTHNQIFLSAMTGFKSVFGQQFMPTVLARSFGLNFTNNFLPLKRFFIKRAMGLESDLPRIASYIRDDYA